MLRFALRVPFSVDEQAGMRRLHAMLPSRVFLREFWVEQVPGREWRWGDALGITADGVTRLRAGEWRKVPGLFMHEHGHAIDQVLVTDAQRALWAQYCRAHPDRLTDYRRGSAVEQFAEAVVRVYQRPLPRGYSKPHPETDALIRHLVEG